MAGMAPLTSFRVTRSGQISRRAAGDLLKDPLLPARPTLVLKAGHHP
jgi:hypothetical protein